VIQTFVRVFRQLLRAQSGTVDEAMEVLVADLSRVVIMDSYSLAPLCAVVELGDLLAAPAMVEQASQALSVAVERGALFSHGWMFLLPRVLGVAATLQRQWDTAEARFLTAIVAATHVGARPELARTHLDYARMLVARGRRGDRRQAIGLVRQAAPMFHELGMAPFARRAAELAEALRTRVLETPRPRATYPNRLSEREVEILRHMAQGHTNQEIADNLVLGSHTVARHIRSIFKKIGVKNRTGAVAFAFEQQLAPQPEPYSGPGTTSAPDRVSGEGQVQALRILLVTDMEGSTSLIQRWGDAQAHELLRVHNAIIRQGLRRHHGIEIMHTGDGVEASFPSASSAVAGAVAIQQAFARHNREHPEQHIRVRMGIHAGEPILTEGRLFGTAVHTTFRICARARPGQILISDVVRQLAAGSGFAFVDRGRVTLKGLSGRFRLYEVQWEDAQV
jgi:class 3 adenylate cyclase/DNA-binding CsgD family transcriptional regulator